MQRPRGFVDHRTRWHRFATEWTIAASMLVAVLLAGRPAAADVAVVHVEGTTSKRLERDIGKALPEGIELQPSRAADAALGRAAKKNPLPGSGEELDADAPLVKAVRRVLAGSHRDLAILVVVGRGGEKSRDIRVVIVPKNEDRRVFFHSVVLPTFHSAEEHVAWWRALLKDALANQPEPAEPQPEETEAPPPPPKPPPEKPSPPPETAPKSSDANYWFALTADLSFRQFTDNESGSGQPRSYLAFPIPGFHASAELYPLFGGHLGLEGRYGMSLAVRSKTSDGRTVGTQWIDAGGALKARVFTAHRDRSPWLALLLGYGYSEFVFEDGPPNRELPTAVYRMLRVGLDGRAPIDRATLSVGAEYDRLLAIDSLGNVTPAPPGNGVTARAGAGFEVARGVSVRADFRYTWLVFPISRDIASNVVDQYVTFGLGVEVAF